MIFTANNNALDDRLSSYQSFDSHEDTKRLEYTNNDNSEKIVDEKQYFDNNYNTFDYKTIGADNEGLNRNEFSRRKSINYSDQSKANTASTRSTPPTTDGPQFEYNRVAKTAAKDELNEGKEETSESLDSNRLFRDDLQNPDFEEAISSYVDENGGIHLHDGPGGLFGLVPPHTVSDHHIDVFSRPAVQDNRVS